MRRRKGSALRSDLRRALAAAGDPERAPGAQLARSDPVWVRDYVARRRELLAPLSVREATKHLRGV